MDKKKTSGWENKGSDLSLHKPTGTFYVRKKFLRQKIPMLFKSTGETIKWKAKERAIFLIQAHLDRHLKRSKTFADVAEEFLRSENPNPKKRRASTQKNNIQIIAELNKELGEYPITQIADEAFWSDWFDKFVEKKTGRSTFNDYIVRMNMLMRFAYRRKYLPHLAKFEFVDEVKETGRVLTSAEIEALYAAMGIDGKDQFTLAYECGMRLREMLSLTWDRVDFDKETITLRRDDVKTGRKTGRGRTFIATAQALERLRARRVRLGDKSPFVFPAKGNPAKPQRQNKNMWMRAKKKAGITSRCRWHDIRHTAITHMLMDMKQDITLVSEYVGTSVRTLQKVYLHSTAEQTRPVASALRIKG